MRKNVKLAIKYNNTSVNYDQCGICGCSMEADIPLGLFLCDTHDLVCHKCGKEHAPELVILLDYFNANIKELWSDYEKEGAK